MSQQNFEGEPPGSPSQQVKVPLLQLADVGKTKSSGQTQLKKNGVDGGRGTGPDSYLGFDHGGDDDNKDDDFQAVDDGPLEPEELHPGQENAGQMTAAGSELQKKIKQGMLGSLKNSIKTQASSYKPRSKEFLKINFSTYHDHCVLEPQDKWQKVKMMRMNGLEVLTVILIGMIAVWQASFISVGMYVASGMLFIASKKFVIDRLHQRQVISAFIFFLLIVIIIFKIVYVFSLDKQKTKLTQIEVDSDVRWMKSIGYSPYVTKTAATAKDFPHGKIGVHTFQSLIFELCTFIILTIFNYYTKKTQNNIKYLNEHEEEIHRLVELENENKERNDRAAEQAKHKEFEKEEFDGLTSQLIDGTNQSFVEDTHQSQICDQDGQNMKSGKHLHKNKPLLLKSKTQAKIKEDLETMKKLAADAKKYRQYIECEAFKNMHHIFLNIMITASIAQAMIFNSLVDITVLFLLLLLKASMAYKFKYKTLYTRLVFFTVYWCQAITQLKVWFVILMSTPQATHWLNANKDKTYVAYFQTFFGLSFLVHKTDELHLPTPVEDKIKGKSEMVARLLYYFTLFLTLYVTQLWKQAKWASIRDLWIEEHNLLRKLSKQQKSKKKILADGAEGESKSTGDQKDLWASSTTMIHYYVIMHDKNLFLQRQQLQQQMQKENWEKINLDVLEPIQRENLWRKNREYQEKIIYQQRLKMDIHQQQSDFLSYLPTLTLWSARILVTFQSYMYCQDTSLLQLIWVVLSFMVSNEMILFISIMFMIPFYSMMFIIVYLKRIKVLEATMKVFCHDKRLFDFDFKYPVLEQTLYYIILSIFFVMISAIKSTIVDKDDPNSKNDYFINIYKNKLKSKHSSMLWKYSFKVLKNIQKLVFILLFIQGTSDMKQLDSLTSLGFIFLFAVYITWEHLYRKTTMIPLIFMSLFIVTRYYYGMQYQIFEKVKSVDDQAKWLDMYNVYDKPDWKKGSSVYFKMNCQPEVWLIIIVFKLLNSTNELFRDKAEVAHLETVAYEAIRHRHQKGVNSWNNISNLIGNQLIYIYILIMIFCVVNAPINNVIIFLLYVQNIILIGSVCSQDKSISNIKWQLKITWCMKTFASVAILLDTIFMAMVGIHSDNDKSSFAKEYPWFYKNLSFLGLKTQEYHSDGKLKNTHAQTLEAIKVKLYFQATYLIMSILIHQYFVSLASYTRNEELWTPKDFKKLYEYETDDRAKLKKQKDQLETNGEPDEEEMELKEENKLIQLETFKKKKSYTQYDLQDRYNFRRWQTQYIIYELVNWWPIFDKIASISHVFNGFIIMYIALYYNVSLFMLIYVLSLTRFYIHVIKNIQDLAKSNIRIQGQKSQIDLESANRISQQYNRVSKYKFHAIRSKVWNFQIKLLQVMAILSAPTPFIIIHRANLVRQQLENPFNNHSALINVMDKVQYWFYICGIFTGNDTKQIKTYSNAIGLLFIGLFLEKAAINWLKNRWGCTYFNYAKFVELETRSKAIKEKWEITPIPYHPEHYKYHNFYKPLDFDIICAKLLENQKFKDEAMKNFEAICEKRKKLDPEFLKLVQNMGIEADVVFVDFIPYKEAIRIKQAIEFSLRVNGRDPSLKMGGWDNITKQKMEKLFVHIDKEEDLKSTLMNLKEEEALKKSKHEEKDQLNENKSQKAHQEKIKEIESHQENIDEFKKKVKFLEKNIKGEEIDVEEKYEEIEILKKFKIEQLEAIIKNAIVMKYKISFSKGMMFVLEALVMVLLMVSIALKSNVFSLIYLVFVIRFPSCEQKHHLFARLSYYLSISLAVQYALYWLNMSQYTELNSYKFPTQFKDFPFAQIAKNENYLKDESYPFPIIFSLSDYVGKKHFLQLAYFLGLGINSIQLENLMLDFFNLFVVSLYILQFRSSIFDKTMEKVFWKYPLPTDEPDFWNRCDERTKKTIIWFSDPIPISDPCYHQLRQELQMDETKMNMESNMRIGHAQGIKEKYFDFNQILINYVDLKYQEIWSKHFVKKIKNQLKEQVFYFRIVKQGSQIVYLGFHIITIFVIILLSIMRQSLVSLIYLLVICIQIMYNVEDALKERSQNLSSEIKNLEIDIRINQQSLKSKIEENETKSSLDLEEEIEKLKNKLEAQNQELKHNKFNYLAAKTNKGDIKLKHKHKSEIKKKGENIHTLPYNFQYTLQILVILDFVSQIVCQMPIIQYGQGFKQWGFRKIWTSGTDGSLEAFNYSDFMNVDKKYKGLQIMNLPLVLQILNCIMIVFVFTQVSIFNSFGYKKYVTQKDSSMDLLLHLSALKGKSVAYRFNNFKIIKILQIQKKKELVLGNFEELKHKMKNWRIMKQQTLNIGIKGLFEQNQQVAQKMNDVVKDKSGVDFDNNMYGLPSSNMSKDQVTAIANDKEKKSRSSVKFSKQNDDQSSCASDGSYDMFKVFDNEDYEIPTIQEKQVFLRQMSKKLVEEKITKINYLVTIYQYVQKNWIEQIFFKNQKQEVEELLLQHSQGSVEIPTELERIMDDEAYDFITRHFQNTTSTTKNELNVLVQQFKRLEAESHVNIDDKIIQILKAKLTDETQLKLKEMTRTWEFTRPLTMIERLFETFFYLCISKISYIIFMMMIYSTYQNAGIITIIYPFMIFGWALLDETRPSKKFWQILKFWTTIVLFCKFFANIKYGDHNGTVLLQKPTVLIKMLVTGKVAPTTKPVDHFLDGKMWGYIKLGLFSYDKLQDIVIYILPEIFILCLLMVNSIYLRMLGFRNQSEHDIEDIISGIERTIERGNIDKVHDKQLLDCCMNLSHQFLSHNEQVKIEEKEERERLAEVDKKYGILGHQDLDGTKQVIVSTKGMCEDRPEKQELELKRISQNIKNANQLFKLETNEEENDVYEKFVSKKLLSKVLDDDTLIYREGHQFAKYESKVDFMTLGESQQDYEKLIAAEVMSAGDNEVDFIQKSNLIIDRNKPHLGMFEKSKYFDNLFPALKIQKPGYDLYGSTTIFLTILIIFVFSNYDHFSTSKSQVIPGKETGNQFSNGMIFLVLFIIMCMLFERIVNRTATKAPVVNQGLPFDDEDSFEGEFHSYFHQESLCVDTSKQDNKNYNRWARGVGAAKDQSGEIKLSDNQCLLYLKDLQEENKVNRTKISVQQKIKYFMHMILLLMVHIYVFWWVPITGNMALYGTPDCDESKQQYYGCKDFHRNPTLKFFYIFLCIYLFLSAMQIKFGLPIMKKPSSVLQYNDNLVAYGAASVYMALPFILEIRCLIDFSFAETSLDIFQFWELYRGNYDMYNTKNGNIYYFQKVIGEPMPLLDRCLMGFLFSILVLVILCGPLVLFSPMAGFIAVNPVIKSEFSINFLINSQISNNTMKQFVTGNMNALENYDSLNLNTIEKNETKQEKEIAYGKNELLKHNNTDWYVLYTQKNAELRELNSTLKDESKFQNWTESRFFVPKQIQLCLLSEYPDKRFSMSESRRQQLRSQLKKALNESDPLVSFQLGFNMQFDRKYPPGTKKHTEIDQMKSLNTSLRHDCQTRQKLLEFTEFECRNEAKDAKFDITFYEAFSPYIILGDLKKSELLTRKPLHSQEQEGVHEMMHDIKLTYQCDSDEWVVVSGVNSTIQSLARNKEMLVDPTTCEYKDKDLAEKHHESIDKQVTYQRISLLLFSMLISSSFLATYSLTTFYLGVVYLLGSTVRQLLIWPSYKAFMWEAVETDSVLYLIQYIYNRRYEKDLAGEEEGYRVFREILHTPEFFKSICGSCLRGTLDPAKDYLLPEDEKKIKQIEMLEKKGFEVKKLKEKILENAGDNLYKETQPQNQEENDDNDDKFTKIE